MLRRKLGLIVSFALLLGCGPRGEDASGDGESASEQGWQSGERLRARLYMGEDGSREFIRWVDTVLDVDCRFDTASDGRTRCVPYWRESIDGYADDACEEALFKDKFEPCWSHPRNYIRVDDGADALAFATGAVYDGTLFRLDGEGNCEEIEREDTDVWMRFGAQLEPSAMVAATAQREGSGRIQSEWWEADDGTRERTGVHDTELKVQVTVREHSSGELRWLATDAVGYTTAWFADSGCSELVGASVDPTEEWVLHAEERECRRQASLYPIQGPHEGGVYEILDDACEPATPSDIFSFFELGAPLSAADLVGVDAVELGGDRLRATYYTVAGESAALEVSPPRKAWLSTLLDSELEQPCQFELHSQDEKLRCFPDSSVHSFYYADAACSDPIATHSDDPCEPLPSFVRVETLAFEGVCLFKDSRVYHLGQELEADDTIFYRSSDDNPCSESDRKDDVRYFRLGEQIEAAQLVTLEEIVE